MDREGEPLPELDQYRILFDHSPVCIHEIDTDGRMVSMNPAGLRLIGVTDPNEIVGVRYLDFVSPQDRQRIGRLMAQALAGQAAEFEFRVAGAKRTRVFTSCFIPLPNAAGDIVKLIGISADVSMRESEQAELLRMNRAQAVLARCNHNLARATDEGDLLQALCDNLVDLGGYGFAWIGYVREGSRPGVNMVAHAGLEHADFAAAALAATNATDSPSACRIAIQSGHPVIVRDIEHEPELVPWRDMALRFGYHSMVALPLKAEGRAFGNLSIFSAEADAFDDREAALLTDLAGDLAYGIQTVRSRAAQAQKVRRLREEAEKDERKRIAATLHDVVGQSMQAVNLTLKRLRASAATGSKMPRDLLDGAIVEAGTAIGQLRELSTELRPIFLERMPLVDAIRFQCSAFSGRTGTEICLRAPDASVELPDRVKEQCFLSFREALANAVRHAKANRVDVILDTPWPRKLTLKIIDDGVGFDTHIAFQRSAGLGLSMIQERAASVGGQAEIVSIPGSGTCVTIDVPLTMEATP